MQRSERRRGAARRQKRFSIGFMRRVRRRGGRRGSNFCGINEAHGRNFNRNEERLRLRHELRLDDERSVPRIVALARDEYLIETGRQVVYIKVVPEKSGCADLCAVEREKGVAF